ncbi:GNAT family acetyltransferase [uncultured Microbacterium sp.]|uniref:GNAT family acetyltransferase n=1 Tax=uncultured Microbacterium sp. TaxID=191216 RepID=UPI0026134953|nr:GNAT family acetyltransferase [uncultured Microbacterium sp.]
MSWKVRAFAREDTDAVIELWQETGLTRPWNDPRQDIERKLRVQPELFLVAHDEKTVLGSVMAGYDGHRGWIYYLATTPARQGEGIARGLLAEAERLLAAMGCPKVQLMVRTENEAVLSFYDAVGYESFDVRNAGKRLIADM